MSVNLIMSATQGGNDLPEQSSLGVKTPGQTTDVQDIFISHDGSSEITDVSFYIMRAISTSYSGEDPDADIVMLLGWADASATKGVQLNMNASAASWQPMKTGSGDEANPIDLIPESLVVGTTTNDGEIPVAAVAKIQVKVVIPSSVSSAGIKGFSFVVAYSATS